MKSECKGLKDHIFSGVGARKGRHCAAVHVRYLLWKDNDLYERYEAEY